MSIRTIYKALAGTQDLLLGTQQQAQQRGDQLVTIDGVSAESVPFGGAAGKTIAEVILTVATTAELASATDAVNVTYKEVGRQVFNTTLNRPVYATGSLAGSTWVFADGTVAHSPA